MKLTVRLWPDPIDGGYGIECVELPGAISQGETEEEALANITDAIEGVLAAMFSGRRTSSEEVTVVSPANERQVELTVSAA